MAKTSVKLICYKASVFTGGNVIGYKGFLRVKKGAVVATAAPGEVAPAGVGGGDGAE